ncbi:UDP-glucose dehydrogenase [Salinispira pacifica]|uniref:UDP-glucose 6-dehydrogenase n=1 Tax=Salinispira pacifica TaxID=1307761 RepID=V5WL87_9SPIO|nr:UDP-glucose dehydrogenase [Salinispira pacifica]
MGLSDFGNTVVGVDINEEKVRRLNKGKSPIYEPGVEEYLHRNLQSGRLRFSSNAAEGIRSSEVILIAVGTPMDTDGTADLSFVYQVADTVADNLNEFTVVVTKSTVPVGTNAAIRDRIAERSGKDPERDFAVVSNPEFLREGRAVQDFFHPDRTVIGYENEKAKEVLVDVYRALNLISVPFVWCNLETAELIKYASNAFLATKIAFINQMANLAETVGADIHKIAKTMGMDGRISPKFLHPGPGYGGSCFPKDTQALIKTGEQFGVDMSIIKTVVSSNSYQKERMVTKLLQLMNLSDTDSQAFAGKRVALLGLAFKQETDDIRESPALLVAKKLSELGGEINAYDPKAIENFKVEFPNVQYFSDCYSAVEGVDAVMLLTEWNEFRSLDLEKIASTVRSKFILDARNLLDITEAQKWGFTYQGVGR